MQFRRTRAARPRPKSRRVLLVAATPLLRSALEPALADVADVRCVPFPGEAFDLAAEEGLVDIVVVDVTYLDESVVRPLIARRFARSKPVVVFVSDGGETQLDDLGTERSVRLAGSTISDLVGLAAGRPLRLVVDKP